MRPTMKSNSMLSK